MPGQEDPLLGQLLRLRHDVPAAGAQLDLGDPGGVDHKSIGVDHLRKQPPIPLVLGGEENSDAAATVTPADLQITEHILGAR